MRVARQIPVVGCESGPAVDEGVASRDRVPGKLIDEEPGSFEPKWFEQQLAHGVFVGLAGYDLDRPARRPYERDIVVRELRAGRGRCGRRDVARLATNFAERLVALTEIPLVVAQPARAVVQALL